MAHTRKTIRNNVVSMLTGNITYNSQQVSIYKSRALPWFEVEFPAIAVYMHEEDADDKESAPRYYDRVLQLIVEVLAEELSTAGTDDIFDDIIEQVENIFGLNPYLVFNSVDPADDTLYKSTRVTQTNNGKKIISGMATIWNVEYRTYAPPAQSLDLLRRSVTSIDAAIEGAAGPAHIRADQTFNNP